MKSGPIVSFLLIILFSSCDNAKNPYVDKEVIEKLIRTKNPDVEHVALIYKNDIYYLKNMAEAGTRITNTPGDSKQLVKMAHNYQKFAYLDGSGAIVIINIQGETTARISQYSDIKSFDWSADDKTLYILNGNKIVYYGPDMKLPEFTYNGMDPGTGEVLSASVSMKGDLAYVIRGFSFSTGNIYKMVIKPADKAADIVFEDNSAYPRMQYVAFSANEQDLVLGYVDYSYRPNNITQMYVFINFVKADKYSFGSNYGLFTPLFNESKSFLVTGYSSGSPNTIKPAAIGFNKQSERKIFSESYATESNVLYTDWK